MASSSIPDQTGLSRVFIIENEVRADREALYHSCMRADAVEQAYGDEKKSNVPIPIELTSSWRLGKSSLPKKGQPRNSWGVIRQRRPVRSNDWLT